MRKPRSQESASRAPIATSLLARMNRKRILADPRLSAPGTVHETSEALQATVAGIREFNGLHPTHAAYVYSHNSVSALAEKFTSWAEMKAFVEIVARAEDVYMPSGPPMSPITTSYFTCWSFFDACAGPANETIGSVLLELCGHFCIGNELSRLIRIMQESRMGFYINRGRQGDLVILEELVETYRRSVWKITRRSAGHCRPDFLNRSWQAPLQQSFGRHMERTPFLGFNALQKSGIRQLRPV